MKTGFEGKRNLVIFAVLAAVLIGAAVYFVAVHVRRQLLRRPRRPQRHPLRRDHRRPKTRDP